MAQAFFCPGCNVAFSAALRGHSCPACGEELIHGRVPAGRKVITGSSTRSGRAHWDHIIQKDLCAYCTEKHKARNTIDHILPKALGGSKGSWTNRTGACYACNQAKAHTPLLHFMLEQRGMDLSHLKDEDGNWPLPELEERPAEEDVPEPIAEPPRDFWQGLKRNEGVAA